MEPASSPPAVQGDNAASLAVVEKAGAQALSLELPGLGTQPYECKFGPGLTPMSACGDPQMSPTSPFSPGPGCFSFAGFAAAAPQYVPASAPAPGMGYNFQAAQQLRSPMTMSAMSPTTPGSEIRRNAANFGIPLSLQPMAGEVGQPLPVRTSSGVVFAPSPTAATSAAVAFPISAPETITQTVTAVPSGGLVPAGAPRPFVTPFSAGLRVARSGGVGGA